MKRFGTSVLAALAAFLVIVSLAGATTINPPTREIVRYSNPMTYLSAVNVSTTITSPMVLQTSIWGTADVFATIVGGTGYITITPQFSADNLVWANAYNVDQTVNYTTSVVTTIASDVALYMNGTSTTKYWSIPLYGNYTRYVVSSSEPLTVTLKAVMKNVNGGN